MFTVWKQISTDSWELVEELSDDLALSERINELRADGGEYRAEKRDGGFATVLEV